MYSYHWFWLNYNIILEKSMKKVYNVRISFFNYEYLKMTFEYTLVTNSVKVTVLPIYIEEQSIPYESCYVWMYSVKIKNQGHSTIQLLNRHWQIIDYKGKINEIDGIGVVGEQPVIKPGEIFKYTSGAYLNVPSGIMNGKYEFLNEQSEKIFEVIIPSFSLDSPYISTRPH
jgi:ApaG protein